MKLLATAVAMGLLLVPGAESISPGTYKIQVTAVPNRSSHLLTPLVISTQFSLFNRPAYPEKIGTAIVICERTQPDWDVCQLSLRLGQGTVFLVGMFPRAATFRVYAAVGGTGLYTNVGGQLIQQPIGRNTATLLFTVQLEAF